MPTPPVRNRKGCRAWLVRWDWAGDHAKRENSIIAVLRSQTSSENVRRFIERVYAEHEYTPAEKLEFMRWPDRNPYRAQLETIEVTMENGAVGRVPWDGRIVCGHNPFIIAEQVENLRRRDPDDPSDQELVWSSVTPPHVDLHDYRIQR